MINDIATIKFVIQLIKSQITLYRQLHMKTPLFE